MTASGAADPPRDGPGHEDVDVEIEVDSPTFVHVHWEFGDYADAYRSAARQLATSISADPDVASHLALPALFLYRHALELALKDAYVWTEMTISTSASKAESKAVDDVVDEIQTHALYPLLERLQVRFQQVEANGESKKPIGLEVAVSPAVTVLDQLDIGGQRLRYPYLSRRRGRSWTRERQGPSQAEFARITGHVEAALAFLLDLVGSWFSDVLDRAIEEVWLADLWAAEERALQLEYAVSLTDEGSRSNQMVQGDPDIIDDIAAELSAELLDFDDD